MTLPLDPEQFYLTTPEAAAFLRLSERTLEAWRMEGIGPRFRKLGPGLRAKVIYRRQDLIDWVEKFGK